MQQTNAKQQHATSPQQHHLLWVFTHPVITSSASNPASNACLRCMLAVMLSIAQPSRSQSQQPRTTRKTPHQRPPNVRQDVQSILSLPVARPADCLHHSREPHSQPVAPQQPCTCLQNAYVLHTLHASHALAAPATVPAANCQPHNTPRRKYITKTTTLQSRLKCCTPTTAAPTTHQAA